MTSTCTGFAVRRYVSSGTVRTDYDKLAAKLKTARSEDAGKPLDNNTRIFQRGDDIAIQFWHTDILTFKKNGDIVLDSGGWKTMTTKARISDYSPCQIFQHRGVWTVHFNGEKALFKDGMVLKANGKIVGAAPPAAEKAEIKLRKRVSVYAKAFVDALYAGKVGAPSLGDCFCCLATKTVGGEPVRSSDHILGHLDESYFVPSLLANALKEFGAAPMVQQTAWAFMKNELEYAFSKSRKDFIAQQIEKCIKRHCLRQLGISADR